MIWFLLVTAGALVLAAVTYYLIALHEASSVGAVPVPVYTDHPRTTERSGTDRSAP